MRSGILKMIATSGFLTAPECTKFVFGRAPDPAGGAYDAPPDPLVGWGGGTPSPFPTPLDAEGISPLDAFGVSYPTPFSVGVFVPPTFKSLATPLCVDLKPGQAD